MVTGAFEDPDGTAVSTGDAGALEGVLDVGVSGPRHGRREVRQV